MLTEAEGGPVAAVVTGANMHDSLLLQDALEAVVLEPPDPRGQEQHLCLDKAFHGAPSEATAEVFGYVPHIRRIGGEKKDERGRKTRKARRWVVERTIAWLNRCRGILIRYEKKAGGELPGRRAARLRVTVVPQAIPAHGLRWFLSNMRERMKRRRL